MTCQHDALQLLHSACLGPIEANILLLLLLLLSCSVHLAGSMQVNGEALGMRDAARIKGKEASSTQLSLKAEAEGAHFMLIEMAKSDD